MCTLILAWQVFADAPVLAAANRDERFDRPSSPPRRLDVDPPAVAPRDETAGGTWIGYNANGVLVAVTNRWLDDDLEGERSRGLLVRDALTFESAEAAARFVERELDERTYAGFNLAIADANAALLFEWDRRLRIRNFDPGVHVVLNVGADGEGTIPPSRADVATAQLENGRRAYDTLQPEPGESSDSWLDRAGDLLGDHDYGMCVHRDGFGTRSASLIRLDADGAARYWFADGPPCETEFSLVTESVREPEREP